MPELMLKVLETKDETPTIKSVKVGFDGDALAFKPGQYSLFSLRIADGSEQSHAFSIASSPTRTSYLQFATRFRPESEFKKAFWALKQGDEVRVQGPFGQFVYDEGVEHAVMLSGGIGIAPLKSMLEYAVNKKINKKITLLFSNRSPEEIPFKQELDEIAAGNENIRVVHTVGDLQPGVQWNGRTGRINDSMIREFTPDLSVATFFTCGPPGMVDAMTQLLKQMGVGEERIKFENFAGY